MSAPKQGKRAAAATTARSATVTSSAAKLSANDNLTTENEIVKVVLHGIYQLGLNRVLDLFAPTFLDDPELFEKRIREIVKLGIREVQKG